MHLIFFAAFALLMFTPAMVAFHRPPRERKPQD